ncbi:hypothetical protein [Rhizobium binxianense]
MSGLEMHLPLSRMVAGCRRSRAHLDLIERQIELRAMRMALTARVKNRPFRRSMPSWTRKDERRLQETIDRLRFERRGELDALSRRLARQEKAIAVAIPVDPSAAMVRAAEEPLDVLRATYWKEQAESQGERYEVHGGGYAGLSRRAHHPCRGRGRRRGKRDRAAKTGGRP